MIARVADHCYWLGRYLERAESTARLLAVTSQLVADADLPPEVVWRPALIVAGEEWDFLERYGEAAASDGEQSQRYMTWDEENLASIRRSVSAARDNARSIREVVSLEVWEALNELHLWLGSEASRREYDEHRFGYYRRVRQGIQLTLGLMRSTMLHDMPLDFLWFGTMLERASQTARTLDVQYHALTAVTNGGEPTALAIPATHGTHGADDHEARGGSVVEVSLWLSLLRACSGFEPFMKRNQGRVTAASVAAFLVFESSFPRSLRYCVRSAWERLCRIRPPEATVLPGAATLERLRALDLWLDQGAATPLSGAALHEALTHVVDELAAVGNLLGYELLGYTPPFPDAS